MERLCREVRTNGYLVYRCNVLVILIVCALSVWFQFRNRQADQGKQLIYGEPSFRYTL